jgi:hypothetical protein
MVISDPEDKDDVAVWAVTEDGVLDCVSELTELELIHDASGRAEAGESRQACDRALARERTAKARRDQVAHERDVLLETMRHAVAALPHEQAEELRAFYRGRLER